MVKRVSKKKETVIAPKKEAESLYKKEVDRVFRLQRENRWNIANTNANQRIEKLKKFKSQVEKYAQELRDALYKDFR